MTRAQPWSLHFSGVDGESSLTSMYCGHAAGGRNVEQQLVDVLSSRR
jgi:hypothetical protein